jgi:carboxypeptidase family protein
MARPSQLICSVMHTFGMNADARRRCYRAPYKRPGSTIVALVVIALVACDAHTSRRGRVVDESGAAIAGAQVVLEVGDSEIQGKDTTDANGAFAVGRTHQPFPGPVRLSVSAPGYILEEYKLQANTREEMTVRLRRTIR